MNSLGAIISECLKNRRAAQKRLYDIYAAKMYGICMRYAKNHHDAQDILQDGFVAVFKYLHTFKNKGSFEGWIKRIMINTAVKHYKEKISHLTISIDKMEEGFFNNELKEESNRVELNELTEIIQTLPAQYRIVFNMHAIEGYSHKEIANALKISEGTSRSNYLRARSILKNKLKEEINAKNIFSKISMK